MAGALSQSQGVTSVIAPEKELTSYYGVHFLNGFLLAHILNRISLASAVKKAVMYPEHTPIAVWKNGQKVYSLTDEPQAYNLEHTSLKQNTT